MTSMPIDPSRSSSTTWPCCPASSPATPAPRLSLVAVGDALADAARPRSCWRGRGLLAQIAALIPEPRALPPRPLQHHRARARPRPRASASRMYGADPRLFPSGTKTGCRRIFAEAGRRPPARGTRTCTRVDDVVDAVRRRCARDRPRRGGRDRQAQRGRLRARATRSCDLAGLPAPGSPAEEAAVVAERLRGDGAGGPRRRPLDAYLATLERARRDRRGARSSATRCAAPACSCG